MLTLSQVVIRDRTNDTSCVARDGFCPDWIRDHIGDYMSPLLRHLELTVASVVAGFAIAFALALLAHRRRWLTGPITGVTGVMYTIPSLALFAILLPITGFGFVTGVVALTSYNLLVIFRNIMAGLDNVPEAAKDAASGMGMTDRQRLWRVELPLAIPEIVAGVRVATTTTVGLAALAFVAGAGGLGQKIIEAQNFKSNIVTASVLCILLAAVLDLLILFGERTALPWRRATSS
ncbi:Choline transport system permease protein OpuBB [Paraconexibacter sp. AEG42_29]|uniref:Choline transport system permease protein OpuBB n=1 Tax=Paraconexibacter sp. AEG42_29 TaxID=2997339 RepID=A0AAU7AVN8_9ACTN